jgi:ABC-type glycerol-3-phosphate transport system substrate-binding protein
MKKKSFGLSVALLVGALGFGAASAQEPVTLNILARGDTWNPNNVYEPMIEEALGINLEFRMVPNSEYAEVRNVTMASGDLPDAIRVGPTEQVYSQYIDAGLLLPLNDLIESHPAVRDAYSPEVWEANTYSDGNIYHIPRITGVLPVTIAYRGDWADALGIEAPTTVEEFQAMLQAFQEQDPAGLGSAMIPFVPNRLSGNDANLWLDPVTSPFGVNFMAWVASPDDPNRIVLSHTLPGFKDAMNYVRELYAAGLLDQTWGVSEERGLFKFYAGVVGATTDWPQFDHLRTEAILNAFPDSNAEIRYIMGLTGPSGIQGGPQVTPNAQDLGSSLTTAATPEEAEAFFDMLEWQYTEGYEVMTMGVEGQTFDIGEDGIARRRGRDAVLEQTPDYDLYMLDRVFFAEPPAFFDYTRQNPSWNDVSDEMFAYVSEVLTQTPAEQVTNYLVNSSDPVILDNLAAIESLVDEFYARAILTPDFDMDAEFDAFLSRLEANNLAAVTDAVNALNSVEAIDAISGAE